MTTINCLYICAFGSTVAFLVEPLFNDISR